MGFYTAKTKAYDKLAANYLAFIQLASIRLLLKGAKAGDMPLTSAICNYCPNGPLGKSRDFSCDSGGQSMREKHNAGASSLATSIEVSHLSRTHTYRELNDP
jgi:hypothetical protein